MKILCNGPRKAGTHFLQNLIAPYGFEKSNELFKIRNGAITEKYSKQERVIEKDKTCAISHIPHGYNTRDNKVLCIFRHPKNIVVSHVRWILQNSDTMKYQDMCEMSAERQLIYVMTEQYTDFYEEFSAYTKWWGEVPCFRFESVYHDHKYYFYAIGQLLGLRTQYPGPDLIFGNSLTYNNRQSSWREWFTPKAEKVFEEVGGYQLMQEWGYAV